MAKATYLFITLLFIVGTQIASSKSVGEVVKDTAPRLANTESKHLKRQAENEEEPTTTVEPPTTSVAYEETTTIIPDEEVDAATVKPLDKKDDDKKDKQVKNPKKPIIPTTELVNRGQVANESPATSLLPPMPFSCIPPSYYGLSPPLPQYPTAFAQPAAAPSPPWAYSFLLPPTPAPEYIPTAVGPADQGYHYPQPSGPAFSAGGFASASASANGHGGSVSTSTSPGDSVQTSFGLGNRGSFPDGGSTSSSGTLPSTGGVASQSASSHSSSGPNGQHSSSSISSAGPNGIKTSYSQSGPSGFQQGTYGTPYQIANFAPPQPFPNVHSSGGSFVSASGTIPPGGQPSFISIRGSFPDNDDESVAIEVNGPEGTQINVPEGAHVSRGPAVGGASGVPQYSGPNYAYSGPGYASSGAYAPGYYGGPGYAPYANNLDFNNVFQQYFAQLQAQQEAFQKQIQAQIAAQQQAGGTFVSGGAFMTNGDGKVDPNGRYFISTSSSPNYGAAMSSVDSRFGFGGTKSHVSAFPSYNRIWDQSNQVDGNFGYPSGPASAFSSINVGPQGGYQQGAISPARPGIFSRFAEEVPPPSGNSYGVFSSSSSSSSTGPDGKTISHKSATVGVNDNGKISVKTVHDP